ncbi:MAG: helix-hairpin-helix domain-containing protein [Myxococcota bacterium]|jgi:competence ComEA-like helix-hairpin-helix protein|nr:helix-hairpin-helix domain-containing protein [Myxococcota bacterium]
MSESNPIQKKPSIAAGVALLAAGLCLLVLLIEFSNLWGESHPASEVNKICEAQVEVRSKDQSRRLLCLEDEALSGCGLLEPGDRVDLIGERCAVKKQGMAGDFRLLKGLKLNINKALDTELALLAGIGPILSNRIVAYRREHGPFKNIYQLTKVSGIGDATVKALEEFVEVKSDKHEKQ